MEHLAHIKALKRLHKEIEDTIVGRLNEFKQKYKKMEEPILWELIFCLLTPQSRAKTCWRAVEKMKEKQVHLQPSRETIISLIHGVRFKYKKGEYILEAIKKFMPGEGESLKRLLENIENDMLRRDFLVKEIKGLGMKEASHFLRNIGWGEDIAILDRHILKNLRFYGVIDKLPSSISRGNYLEIEKKMREFSLQIGIPMSHLDLLLWYKETGEVFK